MAASLVITPQTNGEERARLMAEDIPEELFDRKTVAGYVTKAVENIRAFSEKSGKEGRWVVKAAFTHIAVLVLLELDRKDLAEQFAMERAEAIAEAVKSSEMKFKHRPSRAEFAERRRKEQEQAERELPITKRRRGKPEADR